MTYNILVISLKEGCSINGRGISAPGYTVQTILQYKCPHEAESALYFG